MSGRRVLLTTPLCRKRASTLLLFPCGVAETAKEGAIEREGREGEEERESQGRGEV